VAVSQVVAHAHAEDLAAIGLEQHVLHAEGQRAQAQGHQPTQARAVDAL
jgi:hypothetical protein